MKYFPILICCALTLLNSCSPPSTLQYTDTKNPWEESLGNHRAVLKVEGIADAIKMDITWRRHDPNPEQRKFIIIEATSGDTIPNIHRLEVNNEKCALVFGPVKHPGTYFFYYLPYIIQKQYGFYNQDYPGPEAPPNELWLHENNLADPTRLKTLPPAKLLEIQARTAFDSFYPMEVIALAEEKEKLEQQYTQDYLIFPESRTYPIRMKDAIPQRWIERGPSNRFSATVLKNEYFTFQLGIYATRKDLKNLKVRFSALENVNYQIPSSNLTCFNIGGIDAYGKTFEKRVDLEIGHVQPLWIGVDIPRDVAPGRYEGSLLVTAENAQDHTVELRLNIKNETLADRGDSEPWRHSRLRWLNSKIGMDDQVVAPFQPITALDDLTYHLSGKKIAFGENNMPRSMDIYGTEILANQISFVVETDKGMPFFGSADQIQLLTDAPGVRSASWESTSGDLQMSGVGIIEADGYLNYKISLHALKDVNLTDVRLEIPMKNAVASYMMGMGLPGSEVSEVHDSKWQGPHDSFWIGNEKGGLWCEMRGGDYHGPLLNLYRPAYPDSWFNHDRGGFRIERNRKETKAVVYSGRRELKTGKRIDFEWSFLLTPVKKVNYSSQFLDRYFHNAMEPIPSDEDLATGVKIINLHHANKFNPHINYPFIAVKDMKDFVDQMHQKGQRVKIYYTIRELTNYTTELWALRSLGNEILGDGNGGGYPWLREHLVEGYRPQWYQYFPDKSADASIVNAPGASRWYNYYLEGLAWLVKNVDIDGLYLDDVTYDRRILKRMRKVLDHEKEGCLIDLHSNTGFSKGPATQYAEFFPYIDKIWFGESFKYDEMSPENWLVEVSGIPFGHMGDMLHGGGNRWLGMLFGMTVRHPWLTEGVTCDPRPVWKLWDNFGIHTSRMIGFWEEKPPVTASHRDVLVTSYLKEGKCLLSLGNFSDEPQEITLSVDWNGLGMEPENVRLWCPAIKDFQSAEEFKLDQKIPVEPRKGWLIIIEKIS